MVGFLSLSEAETDPRKRKFIRVEYEKHCAELRNRELKGPYSDMAAWWRAIQLREFASNGLIDELRDQLTPEEIEIVGALGK